MEAIADTAGLRSSWYLEGAAALRKAARDNRRAVKALSAARQQDKLREATLGTLRSVSAALDAAEAKAARLEGALSDPVAVHANMLRGTIAKLTVEQIIHIYGADALRAALTEGTPE